MDDYTVVLIPFFAEVFADEKSTEKVKELRLNALRRLMGQLSYYKERGIIDRLIVAIAEKKGELIMRTSSQTDMDKIMKLRCPHYDGNRFIADETIIPEEEIIGWSEASLRAPLNEAGYKRYMELFKQIFPQEYKAVLGGEV